MKKSSLRAIIFVLAAASVLVVAGCSMDGGFAPSSGSSGFDAAALAFADGDGQVGQYTAILYAGQTIEAGAVTVTADDDDLIFTYSTIDGWELTEVHLALGTSYSDIPQNRQGNPMIGHFPYKESFSEGVTEVEIRVSLEDFGGEEALYGQRLYIAAHAVVQKELADGSIQKETGWGAGERMTSRGSWATFFSFVLVQADEDDGVVLGSETAFAYGGEYAIVFDDVEGFSSPRWGWTNGPLTAGSYTFAIYAGAGQSDITRGTLVGELLVDYDGSTAEITYSMFSGFFLAETHLHVGPEPLARNNGEYTVAPGQYSYKNEGLDNAGSDSYVVSGLNGEIYVVAHAVVLGQY